MNRLHHETCACAPCRVGRAIAKDIAFAEEMAGRERAWRESRSRARPQPGTREALARRYGSDAHEEEA